MEDDEIIEVKEDIERFKNYYKLPKIILEIMNWLCETRFYKKTYEKRKESYEDFVGDSYKKEKWMFCDFTIDYGTLEKPLIIRIGEIPRYQGEHEKSLGIVFNNREECYIRRGYATGLYASKVIANEFEIPKYMKEELYKFIDKYKVGEE